MKDHLSKVSCNQSLGQRQNLGIGTLVPGMYGRGETQSSLQLAVTMEKDREICGTQDFNLMKSGLQNERSISVGVDDVEMKDVRFKSNDICGDAPESPGDMNVTIKSNDISCDAPGNPADDGIDSSGVEKEEEQYFVPLTLWTAEMNDLFARKKAAWMRWSRKKTPEVREEARKLKSQFKYAYRHKKLEMKDMPNFEELKKIALEEKKKYEVDLLKRKNEQERIRQQKEASQAPMREPFINRMQFNRGMRHQRGPPFYSALCNAPRFPDRSDSERCPDLSQYYMEGYQAGFAAAARRYSMPFLKPWRPNALGNSARFSSPWQCR